MATQRRPHYLDKTNPKGLSQQFDFQNTISSNYNQKPNELNGQTVSNWNESRRKQIEEMASNVNPFARVNSPIVSRNSSTKIRNKPDFILDVRDINQKIGNKNIQLEKNKEIEKYENVCKPLITQSKSADIGFRKGDSKFYDRLLEKERKLLRGDSPLILRDERKKVERIIKIDPASYTPKNIHKRLKGL